MIKRRRFNHTDTLEAICAEEAKRLHDAANHLPPGLARDTAMREARQMEVASHMSDWLESSGLRSPQ